MSIKLSISNPLSLLSRQISRVSNNLEKKKRGAYLAAAITIQKWTVQNIEAEGRNHDNFSWPSLRPSTIAARRKGKGSGSPKALQDTGRLKGAFRATASNAFGEVVNNVGYADVHEEGLGRVPQRKIWPSEDQAGRIVRPVFDKWVDVQTRSLR